MPAHISFSESSFAAEEGETVLDCLTRNGIPVPHACRSGVCQSCLMQATDGDIPPAAQSGLKPTYRQQGFFLSCQCRPTGDMTVRLPHGEGVDTPVQIVRRDMLNHNVLCLHLKPGATFPCEPGQYVTLMNDAGVARSYSIANDPGADGLIELHIRLLSDGVMSRFLMTDAEIGTFMNMRGPAGTCFYVPEADMTYPMILAGTGTGLAPLYAIARQALGKGHRGPIHLFHGALREADLYLVADLQALARAHADFHYVPCVLGGDAGRFYRCGNIEEIAMAAMPADKRAVRLFLCGAPELVKSLRRKAFLAGIGSAHIFADAFLPSKSAGAAA